MSKRGPDSFDRDLMRVASAVSDGQSVDWDKEETTRPDLSESLRSLRTVANVARACGSELESEDLPDPAPSSRIRMRHRLLIGFGMAAVAGALLYLWLHGVSGH